MEKKKIIHSKKFKKAIDEFLSDWRNRDDVLGILLVGSYATGLQNFQSDVDICIILNNTAKYWKRGNVIISDFLIEYAVYPIYYFRQIQKNDMVQGKRLRTRMLATGQVLFDNSRGVILKLQDEARTCIRQKLPQESAQMTELHKYYLWDQLDNLRYLSKIKSPEFHYAYYSALQNLIESYVAFLRVEIPRPNNVRRFLTDEDFQKRYALDPIPDTVFSKSFEKAMCEPSLEYLEQLTNHVHECMGGFNINKWTLSGKIRL